MEKVWCLVPEVSADLSSSVFVGSGISHCLLWSITLFLVNSLFLCEPVPLFFTIRVAAVSNRQPEFAGLVPDGQYLFHKCTRQSDWSCGSGAAACAQDCAATHITARIASVEAQVEGTGEKEEGIKKEVKGGTCRWVE